VFLLSCSVYVQMYLSYRIGTLLYWLTDYYKISDIATNSQFLFISAADP
jgi:hypothetical protein